MNSTELIEVHLLREEEAAASNDGSEGQAQRGETPSEDDGLSTSSPDDEELQVHELLEEMGARMREGEVRVYFPGDHTFDVIALKLDKYTTHATSSVDTWMLLERTSLSVDKETSVLHPPAHLLRGRPTTRRRCAAAGPLGPKAKGKRKR